MNARPLTETDRLPDGLVERVAVWSVAGWVLSLVAAAALDRSAALGLAVGGAVSLGSLLLYRAMVRAWSLPLQPRKARLRFGIICAVKWPLLGVVLYAALASGLVSPLWLCLGGTLVPAMATAVVLRAVAVDGWRRVTAGEGP